jgi:hypothetical protein
MPGWRGSADQAPIVNEAGKNYLRLSSHGSGGIGGLNMSPRLGSVNPATGQEVISNTSTLPTRSVATTNKWWNPPNTIPGEPNQVTSGVPGVEVNRGYGNPGMATQAAKAPSGWGGGSRPAPGLAITQQAGGNTPGGEAGIARVQPYPHVSALGVGQETSWRGGLFFSNDVLEAYDRHGVMNSGTERGGGRGSGETDPIMDGPARPSLRIINRVINWQQGQPLANQDQEPGENRAYNKAQATKPFAESAKVGWGPRACEPGEQFVGEQGTGWSPIYGGAPNLYQPYGSYAGYTANEVKGIQSPAAPGSPQDGPQLVFSGLPHGLHSQTYPDYSSTLGRYLAVPQMQQPRIDRPSNSTIGGQAFNQLVVPQGEVGTAAVKTTGVTEMGNSASTSSGIASQAWRGNQSKGWRGIRPGGGQT